MCKVLRLQFPGPKRRIEAGVCLFPPVQCFRIDSFFLNCSSSVKASISIASLLSPYAAVAHRDVEFCFRMEFQYFISGVLGFFSITASHYDTGFFFMTRSSSISASPGYRPFDATVGDEPQHRDENVQPACNP